MLVEIAPGPASIGTASGVIAMSSFVAASCVSSLVCFTGERRARNISSAINISTTLPAILNAGNVIPKKRNRAWPVITNTIKIAAAMTHARRAMRMRDSGESFGVMAKKTGTVAIGSMITKSEVAESRIYLRISILFRCDRARRQDRIRHAVDNFLI